jgi:hypothetical protein
VYLYPHYPFYGVIYREQYFSGSWHWMRGSHLVMREGTTTTASRRMKLKKRLLQQPGLPDTLPNI